MVRNEPFFKVANCDLERTSLIPRTVFSLIPSSRSQNLEVTDCDLKFEILNWYLKFAGVPQGCGTSKMILWKPRSP